MNTVLQFISVQHTANYLWEKKKKPHTSPTSGFALDGHNICSPFAVKMHFKISL